MRTLVAVTITAAALALGGCQTGCASLISPLSNPNAPTDYTAFTDNVVAMEVAKGPCFEPAQRAAHEKWVAEKERRVKAGHWKPTE
jgi:hypothetical protein